ncbi:peptidoglycan DD-metalloendopeptidase family protein [Agromyces sp. ISL-38]|uniref:peptidoglycan DD-metalloendopeptidase family protein n=1 Tax=Agromyces sp. ISL-38 TaxID=2819107 RepID=UPI001BE4F8A1|nr:peptidoglycan DD-metalloendopeptidase family protein [Agromyces sp. ISL-38]MBT2500766.1 peptidoglycan DD-metalloendopeptidase family protein [Agromyces sp. ISL-38]MBT2516640.1 peptidoglycan DD-metalloendopeptidase family protein [Streptomyces sp. ISL-90]
MLESPLVPDDSTPGTQASPRPERPLTRRELREREAAEARQAAGNSGIESVAEAGALPSAGAVRDAGLNAGPPAPQPNFDAGAGAPQPSFDELFGITAGAPAEAASTPRADRRADASSHPGFELPSRRTTAPAPARFSQAEPADSRVDPDSAFAVSRSGADRASEANAFDSLFGGLGDDVVDEADSANTEARSGRKARASKPTRAERKAEKAARAAGPRRSGAPTTPVTPPTSAARPFVPPAVPTPAARPFVPPAVPTPAAHEVAANVAAAASAGISATVTGSAGVQSAGQASPGRFDSLDIFAMSSPEPSPTSAAAMPSEALMPAVDAGRASHREATALLEAESRRRSSSSSSSGSGRRTNDHATRGHAPRDPRSNHTGIPSTRNTRPARSTTAAAATTPRRRRGGARVASVVAMSFAALLAVATSVPSLSLLTPADVQAMALESAATTDGPDAQRVEITGGALAQSVDREGYKAQSIEEYAKAAGIRAEATFTNNPAGTIQWPFAVGVHIGDRFGYRDCYGCSTNHGGQDFNPGLGAEIQAIADGTVAVAENGGGSLGVVMMIDHMIDGQLVTSVYAHMEYDSMRFNVGDQVKVGDIIGTTGDTGMSTGPHLHFEIRLGGVDGTKIDPLIWLYENTN